MNIMKTEHKEATEKDSICFKAKNICVHQNENEMRKIPIVIKIDNLVIIKEEKNFKQCAWKEKNVPLWEWEGGGKI